MQEDPHYLSGLRVLEIGDELGEYCGKLLAGLGADVVRVEQPGGSPSRKIGPFYHDEPDANRSLYFWHYNHGKRSVVIDLRSDDGREQLRDLLRGADIVVDSTPRCLLVDAHLAYEDVGAEASLIWSRITPFGDTGPWAGFAASDLVHLALGGVVMNCGYDPGPDGQYDTLPIAPQMWQAYHIAGEMSGMAILAALMFRRRTGRGQLLETSVHEAVSKATETDLPDWIFLRQPHHRLTSRHSAFVPSDSTLASTKDGRYLLPYNTYLRGFVNAREGAAKLLANYGVEVGPAEAPDQEPGGEDDGKRLNHLTSDLIGKLTFDRDLWLEAQALQLPWGAIRRPSENLSDSHWQARGSFVSIRHESLGETFSYVGARWASPDSAWRVDRRPPLLGEHTTEVQREWTCRSPSERAHTPPAAADAEMLSERGRPFALDGVRVLDLSWMLASAGAGRFLSAFGAEVIKVEHSSRLDGMRYSQGVCPTGGRPEREAATSPIPSPDTDSPNRGGAFMEINAGKLSLSLNLKTPEGRTVLEDLVRASDVVVEGFSPGTMVRMGFGYDRLKELNPRVIYAQQSGFGQSGTYGPMRAYGPTAQAVSGLTDMSGLPEPYPPAGIGYSYLDWFGAYNLATAILAALNRREATGAGTHIDASQGEVGLYLTGTAILDASVNGRVYKRTGNRSPDKLAAPHGVYPVAGKDRWIALACFTEEQWGGIVGVIGDPGWFEDERFATLTRRLKYQDELDRIISSRTARWEPTQLMYELQHRAVPAGLCQTAEDRAERDPQLAHCEWLVELDQAEIGRWPVKEHPTKMSESPPYIGGRFNRSGPNYGQDTDFVLREILGRSAAEIDELRTMGIF